MDGLFVRDRNFLTDAKLVRTALKNGYPITDEIRKLIVAKMTISLAKSSDFRVQRAAAQVLVQCDAMNAKREEVEQEKAQHLEDLNEQRSQRVVEILKRIAPPRTIEGSVTTTGGGTENDS